MNIRIIFFLLILLSCNTESPKISTNEFSAIKKELLSKWNNSVQYSLDLFSKIDTEELDYKPTEAQMDIAEQITHMSTNMHKLGNLIYSKPTNIPSINSYESIDVLLDYFKQSCDYIEEALKEISMEEMDDVIEFAGRKLTKREIVHLINDHHTHHRAQLIVYIRLLGKKPTPYIGF